MKSYIQLFLTSVKSKSTAAGRNSVVVAFTSTESQEGVSYVVNSFAVELAQRTSQRVLVADAESLQRIDIFNRQQITKYCQQVDLPNLYLLLTDEEFAGESKKRRQLQLRNGNSKVERGLKNLQNLRFAFDFILVDCPALSISGDAPLLAPSANGVVLVVEASRTRREQVRNSIQMIETVNGNLLGCVMNKRRYPIPNWLYHRI